jgi:hypothetical protein
MFAAIALVALGTKAHADEPSQGTQAVALRKFEDGRIAYEAGRFDEALASFQDSIALLPSPNSRLYIARCHRQMGRVASAWLSFRMSAREANDRLAASGEKRYAATRDAATSEGADIEARVPRVTIAVPAGLPPGFAVTLDGREVPRAAWGAAAEIDPGAHTIAATGPRLSKFEERIELKEADQRRVEVVVTKIPTAVLTIALVARPSGVALALDGAPIDPDKTGAPMELDPGPHMVTATAPGYLPFRWQKTLTDREEIAAKVTLEPIPPPKPEPAKPRGTPRWLFFATSGAAVASLAVASGFAIAASSARDDELAKDPLVRSPETRDRIASQASAANVLFVGGGVLGVGAAVLFFTTQWKDVRVGASAASGQLGFTVRGGF